jgi:stage V sporulation protein G
MEITEVRIKLMEDSDDRLQGFCSITFDDAFVVRDLKIIDGANGPFVAMPSRKLTGHCHQCGAKNHLKAQYCNHCGSRLREDRLPRDADGRAKLYADIAHPINSQCREMIQNRVIQEFRTELDRAKQPGYVSRYDEEYDDDIDPTTLLPHEERRVATGAPLPAGSHLQPAQSQPPPPHISVPQPAVGGVAESGPAESGSMGGPHFGAAPSQREPAQHENANREAPGPTAQPPQPSREESGPRNAGRDTGPGKPKPKGDFGAGVF